MTLKGWIDSRTPAPPAALVIRMRPALDAAEMTGAVYPGEGVLEAALNLVGSILCDGSGSRTGAITLLAADALVTYAFEAAAEEPDRLETLAEEAMIRIASTAERAR